MRAQETWEFSRKRQCGNKAQTNPANLEYVPLTTVTLVISSRSFRNCKEEHMVNKTAWQRRIPFSAWLWPSANTWQDEVPWDTCSDSSPLLHSVGWTGPAELYQELGGTERLLSILAGVSCQSSSATLHTLPCAASIGTGGVPNPQPFMHPRFHQQCSLSIWACPHLSWAAHQDHPSPAWTPQSECSSPSVLSGAAGGYQALPGGVCSSQSPLLGSPLRPNHTTEMPLLLHWVTQQLLHSHRNSTSQPEVFKWMFPMPQNDAAILWLPALHLSSCQSLAAVTGRVQVSLREWAEESPWSFILWWWCSPRDSCYCPIFCI